MEKGFDPTQITIDFEGLSVTEMQEFLQASNTGNVPAVARTLAARVKRCPKEWGKADDPQTYTRLPFYGAFRKLTQLFGEQGRALSANFDTAQLAFDLEAVTASEMYSYIQASNQGDLKTIAGIYAKLVIRCPDSWGDPQKPETYLKLDYYRGFLKVDEAINQASREQVKN